MRKILMTFLCFSFLTLNAEADLRKRIILKTENHVATIKPRQPSHIAELITDHFKVEPPQNLEEILEGEVGDYLTRKHYVVLTPDKIPNIPKIYENVESPDYLIYYKGQFLIKCSILDYGASYNFSDQSFFLFFPIPFTDNARGWMSVKVEVIDIVTNRQLSSFTVEDHIGINAKNINEASRSMNEIANVLGKQIGKRIHKIIKPRKWYARLVSVRGDKIYVNAGELDGVKRGMKFQIIKPYTINGFQIGDSGDRVGYIKVTDVTDYFAICKGRGIDFEGNYIVLQ